MRVRDVGLKSPHQAAHQAPFTRISSGADAEDGTLNPVFRERCNERVVSDVRFDHSNHRDPIAQGLLPAREKPYDTLEAACPRRGGDMQNP